MREFQDRRRVRRFLHSRYAIAVLLLVLALSADALWGIYAKYQKSEELERRMAANVDELQARRLRLEGLNASLGTSEGKEREIRDRFGVIREGEKTIILVDDKEGSGTVRALTDPGLWERFLDLFR
jgi:cell division protein FtsB